MLLHNSMIKFATALYLYFENQLHIDLNIWTNKAIRLFYFYFIYFTKEIIMTFHEKIPYQREKSMNNRTEKSIAITDIAITRQSYNK